MSSSKVGAARNESGFTLIDMLFVIAIIGLLSTLAIPGLMRARGAAQSASALGTMKVVNSAQLSFAITCGLGFYSPNFQTLGVTPPSAIDAFLAPEMSAGATFIKSGYTFSMAGTAVGGAPASCNGLGAGAASSGYAVVADPLDTTPAGTLLRHQRGRHCLRRRGELLIDHARDRAAAGWRPDQVSTSRLDADARATNAARHVGAAPRLPSLSFSSQIDVTLRPFWYRYSFFLGGGTMLEGTKRGSRVLAASLFLLAVSAAATAQTAATAPGVTSPKQHFGFNIGDDYQLATYTQFVDYWQKLDKESDRMKVVEIGKTAEGRPQLMAIITSPENHKKLERYKEISRKLAQAEGVTDDQARALAKEGKAIVWIDGGLHATEVLGAHQLIETVYQLVSRNDAETLRILNDVIILVVHANPDGMELVSTGTCARATRRGVRQMACRGSTRSTSATTTTATSTVNRRPRART